MNQPSINPSVRLFIRVVSILAIALILLSVVFRFLWIDNTPGLNADEPYPIVQLMNALAGRAHLVRSPHGQFFDPVMMATELLTLLPGKPSVFLLRLPAAITGTVTLLCFAWLGRRAFANRFQTVLATLLLAAMPMSIATSRIQWDTTYIPLFSCFVIFPMLDLAAGNFSCRAVAIILGFTVLGIWTHATFALLVVALALGVLFVQRQTIFHWAAARLRLKPSVMLAVALIAVPILTAAGVFTLITVATRHPLPDVAQTSLHKALELAASPMSLLHYLGRVGDSVAGISVYEDIPGLPVSPALRAFSIVISSLLLLATIFLARARDPRDRALAVFWIVALFILVATAGILTVDQIGVERYMIWLLPPAAITLARFGSILGCSRRIPDVTCAVLTISLASIMLWTFFPDYFAPIRSLAYRRSTYPAYWAADRDLKFAAADWIRAEHLSPGLIHAENWWIDYPLQFDLGLDWTITEDPLPAEIPRGQSVVVCFCNSDQYPGIETDYFTHLRARLASAGRRFNTHTIDAADGKPAVAVIVVQPLPSSGRQ